MSYTTKVHSYAVTVPRDRLVDGFHISSILSTSKLEPVDYLKQYSTGSNLIYNGLIDADQITRTHGLREVILEGYKNIHKNIDSRGSYLSEVYVPNDWDENHPIVKHILGQQTSQDRY